MQIQLLLLFLALGLAWPAPLVRAEAVGTDSEIAHLLDFVEHSPGKFVRSGKEYSGKEGADHLRSKLQKAGKRVKTAEDFIDGIASKSYLTGEPYYVKLADRTTKETGPWLHEELARFRQKK